MPIILEQAQLLNPCVSSLPKPTGSALVDLTAILQPPPDQPNIPTAVENSSMCLNETLVVHPQFAELLGAFVPSLDDAFQALRFVQELNQPLGMLGRAGRFPQWDLMTSDFENTPLAFRQVVGIEIANAYLTNSVFPRSLASQLLSLLKKSAWTEPAQWDHEWLIKCAHRHGESARRAFSDAGQGVDGKTIILNARIIASLIAQQSSLRVTERQAAGGLNEMPDVEVINITRQLRKQVETGDADALQTCLAYCLGLTFDIGKSVPFCTDSKSPSVAWINNLDGTTNVDTTLVFPGLAQKRTNRNIDTSLLLVRPLPVFIANAARHVCATNPGLKTVEGCQDHGRNRCSRNSVFKDASDASSRQSIARLIASRGAIAMRAGIPRDLAAYSTLSLSLISNSDHHYLEKNRSEIWDACNKIYAALGWGPAVPDPNETGPAFGSRVTPETEWIRSLITKQMSMAATSRPGKRYSLKSVVDHHNSFCSYVGLMLHILAGGRDRCVVSFQAHTWSANHSFARHGDKPLGPTEGLTPLPMPVTLATQLQLWHIHLHALDKRLVLLGFNPNHPTRVRIAEILDNKPVDLLFALLSDGTPRQLKKEDILGEDARTLKGDFARHLMPRLLTEEGVPFEHTQSWLRHHLEGISVASATAATVQHVWLCNVASALDRVAMNLGLQPIHGITKGNLK